jgi:Anti-sigma-K factor rskA, C-terminal/Putative zinc-finger
METDAGRGRETGHGDAVAYVLGALDPVARERFEAHAATCPECLRELNELGPVGDALALAVPQVDPPPALGRRLLDRAQALAAESPGPVPDQPGDVRPAPALAVPLAVAAQASPQPVQPVASRSRWRWAERLAAPLAAAALVVALGSGGIAFTQRQEVLRANDAAAVLAETLSIMYQPGRVGRELSGDNSTPWAKGTIYLAPDSTDAVLVAYNLPRLSQREAYQLWLNDPEVDKRVSGGTFRVNDKGHGQLIVRSPVRMGMFKNCGVTKEPEKGSPKPTGQRVLWGTLNQ